MSYVHTIVLRPGELRPGMIALESGMRCRVESMPILSKSHAGDRTFYVECPVLNREEVPNHVVPYGFTDTGSYPAQGRTPSPHEHTWTFQGNDLARVAVEFDSVSTEQAEAILAESAEREAAYHRHLAAL